MRHACGRGVQEHELILFRSSETMAFPLVSAFPMTSKRAQLQVSSEDQKRETERKEEKGVQKIRVDEEASRRRPMIYGNVRKS